MKNPKWLNKEVPTRVGSKKQEDKLADKFGGRATLGSGSCFGENDVITPDLEIEAKYTDGKGYRITVKEFKDIKAKCRIGKIPIQVLEFREDKLELAVIELDYIVDLLDTIKQLKNEPTGNRTT